jgi:lysophospholipase L1-like esterase
MGRTNNRRRLLAVALLLGLLPGEAAHAATEVPWVTAWAAAPDQAGPALGGQTVRQVVRTSIGGSSLRIRLSNLYGSAPLTIGPMRVARPAGGSAIRLGTDRAVTFAGKSTVTIAKGGDVLSDPVPFRVEATEELAISLYVPPAGGASTLHGVGLQTAFIAGGDATAADKFPKGGFDTSRFFVTDLEVTAGAAARSIVVIGDSIGDGVGSTDNLNARWPDALADRLQAHPAFASVAVVNTGVAGNRILNDASKPFVGPSIRSRFERDALSKPGVAWIILSAGINDISASGVLSEARERVSVQQITDGMASLVARAHARGVRVIGATLLPRAGARFDFPESEPMRQAVNGWIRASGVFDGVIDFDRAMRDPSQPDRLRPTFDSGDHSHPNDAGYEAMAAAVDLGLFSIPAAP